MYTTHQARPPYEIVKGHRWVLPAIAKAQKSRTLPQPCLLMHIPAQIVHPFRGNSSTHSD